MEKLSHNEIVVLLLAISTMLIVSRVLAELGKRVKLPMVMGELIVGICLGPTVLGMFLPDVYNYLFPLKTNPHISVALDSLFSLSVIMLLFVAGLEVQLPVVLRQGKAALLTGFLGMVIPFGIGLATAWYFPNLFGMSYGHKDHFLFALFFGTALSISALPVISRILMDLNLFKTKIGMVIIASAMLNDLVGWLFFSVILSLHGQNSDSIHIGYTLLYIFGFGLLMMTVGRVVLNRILPWVQTKLSWPGGVLSMCLGLCLLCAAFTESIHIHAILGAFIAGIAIGDSVHLREQAREIIHQFVINFFAPLFFVSIGLKVNFAANFDILIVSIVMVTAYAGKLSGATLGARLGGMSQREALAVGFGMNARGAMEIILGTLAYNAKLIDEKIFVALVVMALVTSLTSGPLMRRFVDADLRS